MIRKKQINDQFEENMGKIKFEMFSITRIQSNYHNKFPNNSFHILLFVHLIIVV